MYQRIEKLFRGETLTLIAAAVLFASLNLVDHWRLALGELGVTAVLLLFFYFRRRQRKKALSRLIEVITYNSDSATGTALLHFPMSAVAFDLHSGEILWANESFWGLCGEVTEKRGQSLPALLPAEIEIEQKCRRNAQLSQCQLPVVNEIQRSKQHRGDDQRKSLAAKEFFDPLVHCVHPLIFVNNKSAYYTIV